MANQDSTSQRAAAVLSALDEMQAQVTREKAAFEAATNQLNRLLEEAEQSYGVTSLEAMQALYQQLTAEAEALIEQADAIVHEVAF